MKRKRRGSEREREITSEVECRAPESSIHIKCDRGVAKIVPNTTGRIMCPMKIYLAGSALRCYIDVAALPSQ